MRGKREIFCTEKSQIIYEGTPPSGRQNVTSYPLPVAALSDFLSKNVMIVLKHTGDGETDNTHQYYVTRTAEGADVGVLQCSFKESFNLLLPISLLMRSVDYLMSSIQE